MRQQLPLFQQRRKHKAIFLKDALGFTLIEILLGTIITAIIGLVAFQVLWSGMVLDQRLRWVHQHYARALMADELITRDLENAVNVDFSVSYPSLKSFDGKSQSFEFLTATRNGIKRVKYFSGDLNRGSIKKTVIGGHVTRLNTMKFVNESAAVEYMFRQESSLSQWTKSDSRDATVEIIAPGLKKDSFKCMYAERSAEITFRRKDAIAYLPKWDNQELPMAVSCQWAFYDQRQPHGDVLVKRDFFLSPLVGKNDH